MTFATALLLTILPPTAQAQGAEALMPATDKRHAVVKPGEVKRLRKAMPRPEPECKESCKEVAQEVVTPEPALVPDWDATAECEAFGDWAWVSNGNGYWFVLQFTRSTWLAYGGTQAELDAGVAPSRARIIEVAENVLAGQGPGAWPNCFAWKEAA